MSRVEAETREAMAHRSGISPERLKKMASAIAAASNCDDSFSTIAYSSPTLLQNALIRAKNGHPSELCALVREVSNIPRRKHDW